MQKNFDNILDFTKLKDKCIFCRQPLKACLTNFIGLRKGGLPTLNAAITSGRFNFEIKHTTESYDISAIGTVDIRTNTLVFTLPQNSDMPFLDQHVARQAFIDLKPYIDLHCTNKKCKQNYSLASYYIHEINKLSGSSAWSIGSLKLFLESFVTNKLVVQNDWFKENTSIYSLINEDADPIKTPFMDFEAMGKDKLLTRVQTLVTFS